MIDITIEIGATNSRDYRTDIETVSIEVASIIDAAPVLQAIKDAIAPYVDTKSMALSDLQIKGAIAQDLTYDEQIALRQWLTVLTADE